MSEFIRQTFYPYKNQNYEVLIKQYNINNLFTDPEFPPDAKSLGCLDDVIEEHSEIRWQRPDEIRPNPQFIVEGAHRFDPDQGRLGNCWFISAVSLITQKPTIFERVCPHDQSFDQKTYAGIFHFRFWEADRWFDVVVDDYLPTINNRLIFCRNDQQPNEFWIALVEKAYAKLHGSYQATHGGQIINALVHMTGGNGAQLRTRDIWDKDELWETILVALNNHAMIGCSTSSDSNGDETINDNGLVKTHAYGLTSAVHTKCEDDEIVQLIRCRNPWGNECEWKGDWCDADENNWNRVHPKDKRVLDYLKQADGEFWMSYRDWLKNFEFVHICYLPDQLSERQPTDTNKKEINRSRNQRQLNGSRMTQNNNFYSNELETQGRPIRTHENAAGYSVAAERYIWTPPTYENDRILLIKTITNKIGGGENAHEKSTVMPRNEVLSKFQGNPDIYYDDSTQCTSLFCCVGRRGKKSSRMKRRK